MVSSQKINDWHLSENECTCKYMHCTVWVHEYSNCTNIKCVYIKGLRVCAYKARSAWRCFIIIEHIKSSILYIVQNLEGYKFCNLFCRFNFCKYMPSCTVIILINFYKSLNNCKIHGMTFTAFKYSSAGLVHIHHTYM